MSEASIAGDHGAVGAARRRAALGVHRPRTWRERGDGAACDEPDPSSATLAPLTDEQRLLASTGDPSALGPLYERHAKRVYGLALAILGSREEAEDLTHEVFLSACQTARFDPDRGSVGAFLTMWTRSRAIDRLRSRARSARLLDAWYQATPPAGGPRTPLEQLSTRRTGARVRAALARLSVPQRRVLEMTYDQGLSQREIAVRLGVPVSTVKSLVRRALAALERVRDGLAG